MNMVKDTSMNTINTTKRAGDSANHQLQRNGLFSETSDGIFFKTREGFQFGPYADMSEASIARQMFVYAVTGDQESLIEQSYQLSEDLMMVEEIEYQSINQYGRQAA